MPRLAVKWIYTLEADYEWPSGLDFGAGCAFEDDSGRRWLELRPGGAIRVKKDYAWDGCSPKWAAWDILFGTPDGVPHADTRKPKTYHASLVHDALYQFLDACLPLTRQQCDRLFLRLLAEQHFAPRRIYFGAVRLLGGLYHAGVMKPARRSHRTGRKVAL